MEVPATIPMLAAASKVTPIPTTTQQEPDNCTICLEELVAGLKPEKLIALGCNHTYHKACIQKWVKKKAECCLCRQKVEKDNKLGLDIPSNPRRTAPRDEELLPDFLRLARLVEGMAPSHEDMVQNFLRSARLAEGTAPSHEDIVQDFLRSARLVGMAGIATRDNGTTFNIESILVENSSDMAILLTDMLDLAMTHIRVRHMIQDNVLDRGGRPFFEQAFGDDPVVNAPIDSFNLFESSTRNLLAFIAPTTSVPIPVPEPSATVHQTPTLFQRIAGIFNWVFGRDSSN